MSETPDSFLARWDDRFLRSHAIYHESFVDEHFDDLIVVLVTGAYLEALLWVGIQLLGYQPKEAKKTLPLNPLVKEAERRHLIDPDLAKLLRDFANLRNNFAHDIDYQLDSTAIDGLEAQLPNADRDSINRALVNMPGYQVGSKARLVLEGIVRLTYECLTTAISKARQAEDK